MQDRAKSIVVLGASGRVGRLIVAEWAARPVLHAQYQARQPEEPGWLTWQLSDGAAALADRFAANLGAVIVLSGVTPAPGAEYALNTALALAGLEAARLGGAAQVLLASSAAVYGRGAGEAALDEAAPVAPVSDYGSAKAEMEQACRRWRDRAGAAAPAVTLLRIGNVVGTDQFFRNMPGASPDKPMVLDQFADGSGPVRSYIGPGSLARVVVHLCGIADRGETVPEVVNIGAPGGGVDMARFLTAMQARGRAVPAIRRAAPPDALPALRLDTALLQSLHRFEPAEAEPGEMVDQWLQLTGQAA